MANDAVFLPKSQHSLLFLLVEIVQVDLSDTFGLIVHPQQVVPIEVKRHRVLCEFDLISAELFKLVRLEVTQVDRCVLVFDFLGLVRLLLY